jgi:hypothetical protein
MVGRPAGLFVRVLLLPTSAPPATTESAGDVIAFPILSPEFADSSSDVAPCIIGACEAYEFTTFVNVSLNPTDFTTNKTHTARNNM